MKIPSSTYRVQLHKDFNLQQLQEIIPYLQELGIDTLYLSPITAAFHDSQHGYDVIDPLVLNPEIGTMNELELLAGRLKELGMGWLQDIVPNHMAYATGNRWLFDVLERGRDSEFYGYFDIDTETSAELTSDAIMAPFLGKTLTECLQEGEIRLVWNNEGFGIQYFDHCFPVAAALYRWLLTVAAGYPDDLLDSIQRWEQAIPQPADVWAEKKQDWIKQLSDTPAWQAFIEARVEFINQRLSLLEELLQNQHYILTHHHLSATRINYRRFFTVNSLICLRMEHATVFRRWHTWLQDLAAKDWIDGLRIDHIDGLAAPAEYLGRLRKAFGEDRYIIAEKILGQNENLPDDWQLQGTTGYEMAGWLNQLMTDPGGAHALEIFYRSEFSEDMPAWQDLVFERKHRYLHEHMAGEWDNLTSLLLQTTGIDQDKRKELREALGYLLAAWPVYRVYPGEGPLPAEEQGYINQAFERARKKTTDLTPALDILEQHIGTPAFFRRMMQFTGPLAAKGIEDTSFYIYNPLISHNEVGDNPGVLHMTPETFHQKMQERLQRMPHSLNAGTTHDTKRGEDARIRLNYLSAIPQAWQSAVGKWRRINASLVIEDLGDGRRAPSLNDEYFIYQSLLGAFPQDLIVRDAFRERFHEFLTKALREASTHTGYDHPDEAYEGQCHAFCTALLEDNAAFADEFVPFVYRVLKGSDRYALSQQLLRLTVPGVPDIYQGSECRELSLVDPDNRLPVDYEVRKNLLKELKETEAFGWEGCKDWIARQERKGAGKLFLTRKVVRFRRDHAALFSEGSYLPLDVFSEDTRNNQVIAFLRRHEKQATIIAAPLLREQASEDPDEQTENTISIAIPDSISVHWRDLFTNKMYKSVDGQLSITKPFAEFPGLLLEAVPPMS